MIFIIILVAILLPLVSKNKSLGLLGSMFVLFIPFGLQYEATNDWPGSLSRWLNITGYLSTTIIESNKEIEYIYVFLVKTFKGFGFFGWLILSAVFELTILYYLIKRYVPKQYYWIAIFILMLRIDYGFLFINSNRQSLALFTTIIASLVLCKEDFKSYIMQNLATRILLAIIIIIIAKNIHSSAILAITLIPIYLIAKKMKRFRTWLIIVFNLLFFSRFFFNANILQSTILMYMDQFNIQDAYDSYINLMDSQYLKFSMFEQVIYLIIMNAGLFMYKRFTTPTRYFSLCIIISIILGGFIYGDLARICQYYYVYMIIFVPTIIAFLPNSEYKIIKKYRTPIYMFISLYIMYAFLRDINHEYYDGWMNFRTILSAPKWI